jgi:GNAT superfamily N-acetyltransferase
LNDRRDGPLEPKLDLRCGELSTAEFSAARRLIASAFAGEPFAAGMFGEPRPARFLGMMQEYASWPFTSPSVVVAVHADGSLLGVTSSTPPGECHLCAGFEQPDDVGLTTAARMEYEFQSRCRLAHLESGLPPHAHISTVATEPFVQGSGVGRQLVAATLDRLRVLGSECVVLECLTSRVPFYERCGFRQVVLFPDPGGPDLWSVLMRIDLTDAGRPA